MKEIDSLRQSEAINKCNYIIVKNNYRSANQLYFDPMSTSTISVDTRCLTPSDPSLPKLALRVIELVDSYMLWVGTMDGSSEDVDRAQLQGNLCKDWACAMPSKVVRSL